MKIQRVVVGQLETNCWVVSNDSGDVAVIDPGDDTDAICAAIDGLGFKAPHVGAVILTHGHFDHVGAADEVADDNGSFIYLSSPEHEFIQGEQGTGGRQYGLETPAPIVDYQVEDGQTIAVGDLKFEVIFTPGHTPGGISLVLHNAEDDSWHLFSGDTLFAGSVGRVDLDGGDEAALTQSLEKIAQLPPQTHLYPGHGPASTLAHEASYNTYWPA